MTYLGRAHDADADWDRALKLAPVLQRATIQLQRAESRARAGDYSSSSVEANNMGRVWFLPSATLHTLARIHALNTGTAAKDAVRPLPEREKRSKEYARSAVELLQRAAATCYFRDPKRIEQLAKDTDLGPLRQREDFKKLMQSLARPKEKAPAGKKE